MPSVAARMRYNRRHRRNMKKKPKARTHHKCRSGRTGTAYSKHNHRRDLIWVCRGTPFSMAQAILMY